MTSHKDEWEEEFDKRFSNVAPNGFEPADQFHDAYLPSIKHFITSLLASQKKEWVEKLKIAKEPLPAITMSAKEAVSFNRGIDTAIALIQE